MEVNTRIIKVIQQLASNKRPKYLRPTDSGLALPAVVAAGVIAALLFSRQAFAISSLDLVNAITPDGGVGVSKNISYGTGALQNLDIYYPKALAHAIRKGETIDERYPLVVFVHGGSWESGNKDQYAFVGQSFAQAGYVTAVINYRKAPDFVYPAFVEDTAQAIAWTYKNADKFYASPELMAVVGQSAGAFNAVAAVSNSDFLAPFGLKPTDVKVVVGIAGPYSYDFRKYDSRAAFPKDGQPESIMPDNLIKGAQPEYLLLTAENDDIVHDMNSKKMVAALKAANAKVTTGIIKNANHATSIGAMATPLRGLNDVREQVLSYLTKALK